MQFCCLRKLINVALSVTVCVALAACGTIQKPGYENGSSLFEQIMKSPMSSELPQQGGHHQAAYQAGANIPGKFQSYSGEPAVRRMATGQGAVQTDEGYQLNFNNVELAELTKVVLRDTLKLSYVFDPKIRGRVTLSTGGAVSRDELLTILETILQMNRAVLLRNGKQYVVAPLATAQASSITNIDYAAERRMSGNGYGVSFFPLHHVSSSAMLRMLDSFVSRAGSIRASVIRNLLIIRGTGPERKTLVDVASSFDVNWLANQSVGIYRLDNARPDELINELNQIFKTADGNLGGGLIRFQPIDRLNAVLVLTSKSSLLRKVESWVRRLDRTDPAAEAVHVYQVENGRAKVLAPLLSEMFNGSGSGGSIKSATDTIEPAAQPSVLESSASAVGSDPSQSNAGGPHVPPPLARQPLSSSSGSSGGVLITADEVNNRLFIRANGRDYRNILDIVRRLDLPVRQVLINATIAEVTLNGNLRYGVQVFLEENGLGALGFSNGTTLGIGPTLPGLNLLYKAVANPKVVLDALSAKTHVRLVSSPSVVAINNETATLQVGDDVPVAIGRSQSVTNPDAAIVNDIQYRKTGVILNVTPLINSDGLVTLKVEQEISSVVQSQSIGNASNVTPTISQRRVVSKIAVYSGQMVVLGGLMSERKESSKNRVPILERVPLVGDVVGKTNTDTVRTELVIFIQPHVIDDPRDATLVASELKKRLLSMAPAFDRRERRDLYRPSQPSARSSWTSRVTYK